MKTLVFTKTCPKRLFSIQSVPRDAGFSLFWMRSDGFHAQYKVDNCRTKQFYCVFFTWNNKDITTMPEILCCRYSSLLAVLFIVPSLGPFPPPPTSRSRQQKLCVYSSMSSLQKRRVVKTDWRYERKWREGWGGVAAAYGRRHQWKKYEYESRPTIIRQNDSIYKLRDTNDIHDDHQYCLFICVKILKKNERIGAWMYAVGNIYARGA